MVLMKTANLRTLKGVIEVEFSLEGEVITQMKITGDFFIYPEDALEKLEQALVGSTVDELTLEERVSAVYTNYSLSTPGITIADWLAVIAKALNT